MAYAVLFMAAMRLIADIRFALRQFRKSPVFTVTILAVLALGVGATAAIFTIFDQALLRSLPVSRPEELVRLQGHSESFSGSFSARGGDLDEYTSFPAYLYLRDNTGPSSAASSRPIPRTRWASRGMTERDLANAELVSGNYFQVLGIPALVGRTIQPADDAVKLGSPVAVLSYGYWQRRFGGDPRVVGRALEVNGHPVHHRGYRAAALSQRQCRRADRHLRSDDDEAGDRSPGGTIWISTTQPG